jgi:hypothetical protein
MRHTTGGLGDAARTSSRSSRERVWIVFLGLLAAWALRSVAGQRRFAWVQMAVEEVAPWWGVNFNGCALGWTEVSHFVLVMLTHIRFEPTPKVRGAGPLEGMR